MIPVIALVGRPNVGKSTLFNCLTQTRDAIVADMPGLTRDRQFGVGRLGPAAYWVVDTGGIGEDDSGVYAQMASQSAIAAREADILLFVVDAKAGPTAADNRIAEDLRALDKRVIVVVNKVDGRDPDVAASEFYNWGWPEVFAVAASHQRGIRSMMEAIFEGMPPAEAMPEEDPDRIKIAIVGRPNVGKSTLINRFLGEERVIVADEAGTTRDSIYIDFERQGRKYTFIDTAGVRRRSRVTEAVEKFSIVKTLQSIERAHVVILVLDGRMEVADQDLNLLRLTLEAGRAVVIATNKWDGMSPEDRNWNKKWLEEQLRFANFIKLHYISALHGTGVGDLYRSVHRAFASGRREMPASDLTNILEAAIEKHQPPLVHGRRIKLRFAHCGGQHPPVVVIHGNQTDDVPAHYTRYLVHAYQEALRLEGTQVQIRYRTSDNPYKDKRNILTPRQEQKRARMMKYISKIRGK